MRSINMKKILAGLIAATVVCTSLPVYATESTETTETAETAEVAETKEALETTETEESSETTELAETAETEETEEPEETQMDLSELADIIDAASGKTPELIEGTGLSGESDMVDVGEQEEEAEDTEGGIQTYATHSYSYTAIYVPSTSLSFSTSDGVSATKIRSELESLITSHEGNSTSINKNDNGTVSIGRLQFRGELALELMRLIVAKDPDTAYNTLGSSLYNEITNSSTSWAARPVNDSEATALSTLLGKSNSLTVQDNYVNSLLSMYLNQAYKEGFRNASGLLYYGDVCNHLGMNYGTKFGKYAINLAGSAGSVTANEMHLASICYIYDMFSSDTQRYNIEYIPLRRTVYSNIVSKSNANGWAYCQSGDSTIPYDDKGTTGTKWLKKALNTYMGSGLTVNNTYDSATTAAVKAFQKTEGLTQDGEAGEKTSSLLIYRIYDNKAKNGGSLSALANIEKINGTWTYTVGGTPDYNYTGLAKNSNGWWYVKDGKVGFNYTGFAENSNGKWYCEGSKVTFTKNSVIKDSTGAIGTKGTWYYVVESKVQTGFTGLADYKNSNGWWYIKNGVVDFTHNGVDKNKNGWWYVTDGKVRFGFTGLANYKNSNGWWYIRGGAVDFTHNGVDKNKNGWWYVTDGKVRFGFTGLADYKNSNGWWYIKDGAVDFTHNGVDKNKNGWWYVTDGKVRFGFTGLANYKNANGWWYIRGGAVDFTANLVAENKNGWWYVKDGKVDFSFSGIVSVNGTEYSVTNGKLDR